LFSKKIETWKFEFLDSYEVWDHVIFSPSKPSQKRLLGLGLKKGAGEGQVSCVQLVLGLLHVQRRRLIRGARILILVIGSCSQQSWPMSANYQASTQVVAPGACDLFAFSRKVRLYLEETFLGESELIPAVKIWTVHCCDVEQAWSFVLQILRWWPSDLN
jgi:hypothetical protein